METNMFKETNIRKNDPKEIDLGINAWVIKLGGSLYNSKYLTQWLHAINECTLKQMVIVPGGGPFADQVRRADEQFNLKEAHSHSMAVLAMQQYGAVFASLCPALALANSKEKIQHEWSNNKVPIWEPYEQVRDQCKLDKSWDITSDSLALWLANSLEIKNVLFVKSSKEVIDNASIAALTDSQCIDTNVQKLSEKYQINIQFLHKSKVLDLANTLNGN